MQTVRHGHNAVLSSSILSITYPVFVLKFSLQHALTRVEMPIPRLDCHTLPVAKSLHHRCDALHPSSPQLAHVHMYIQCRQSSSSPDEHRFDVACWHYNSQARMFYAIMLPLLCWYAAPLHTNCALQPLAEYGSLLDLQGIPNINTPLKITLDKEGVDFIYVHCGQNTLQWRAELVDEDDENKVSQNIMAYNLNQLPPFFFNGC